MGVWRRSNTPLCPLTPTVILTVVYLTLHSFSKVYQPVWLYEPYVILDWMYNMNVNVLLAQ